MDSESTLRQRTTKTTEVTSEPSVPPKKTKARNASTGFSFFDLVRMLGGLAILLVSISYLITDGESLIFNYKYKPHLRALQNYISPPKTTIFTEEQLAKYNGDDATLPIYLAINGSVFDVSANRPTYGPGGSYHFFAGRDATRAYVTGCFKDDLTHDLRGAEDMFLEEDDELDDFLEGKLKDVPMRRREALLDRQRRRREKALKKVHDAVKHWEDFFMNSEKYHYVGKVVRKSLAGKPKPTICKASMRKRDKERLEKEEAAKKAKEAKNQ